jgi:hypothetical protein
MFLTNLGQMGDIGLLNQIKSKMGEIFVYNTRKIILSRAIKFHPSLQ